jgi:hypothetical protein
MKKAKVFAVGVLVFWAVAAYAGQRAANAANAYKATKITTTSVLVSCNDEREPHVSHLDSTSTAIVVTCKQ